MPEFEPINPSRALYIKLGGRGMWEHDCIEQGTLRLGYNEIDHNLCIQGDWQAAHQYYVSRGGDPGAATRHMKQIQEFYEAESDVLWITFHANRLWWCFSERVITLLADGTKVRSATEGWNSKDIKGNSLDMSRLKGSLLKVQAFQGTICNVRESDYLINKINGKASPEVAEVESASTQLHQAIEAAIKSLTWGDFEILADMIFQRAGWQRVGPLGRTQKTIDLELYSPITRETYAVQVKSEADRATFDDYRARYSEMEGFARFYFVVHSPAKNLTKEADYADDDFELILPGDIAEWVVQYGLTDWVIAKAG
jgi:hypothetical protein